MPGYARDAVLTGMSGPGPRALVFRVATIGDMVVAIPPLRAFRASFEPSRVVLLTDEASDRTGTGGGAVLGGSGLIDETFVQGGFRNPLALAQIVMRLRRERLDVALYLPPRDRSTFNMRRDRAFFRACGVRRVIGPTAQRLTRASFAVRPLPRVRSEAEDLLDMLREQGVHAPTLSPRDFDLALSDAERAAAAAALAPAGPGPFIGVAIGSKCPSKRWPLEYFERVLQRAIRDLGLTPLCVGGPDDLGDANALIARLGSGVNLCGALSVRASAAAIQRCRLFLGNDTGPVHLAYATGTPCVGVFAAQDLPGRWEPVGDATRVFRTDIECAGCQLAQCPRGNECLRSITPDRVFAACRDLLAALGGQP
jgi:ADP-heptose:LPS heptosyltransferase